MDHIAVVILNWNGKEMLQHFLPDVIRYSEADGAVVYVADNGSTDRSVTMLRQQFPAVRLILFSENYGFAGGYNRAMQQLDARYVVLLNSDVEVTEHWLLPLIEYMDAHPQVAACQPKLRSWRQRDKFEYAGAAGGFIDTYGYPFCRGRMMNKVEADHGQYDTNASVFWATGAALFIRLEDYREAGGLDDRFFAHMEEIDLCWRLKARGKDIVCIPQSVVYHVGAATLKRENPQKTFLNFRNNLLMLYKNLPEHELRSVMRVRAMLDYLAACYFLVRGAWRNAWAVIRARKAYRKLRPQYQEQRNENLNKQVVEEIYGRVKASILLASLVN
ncbi:MAG: glycosyltransferase family 2 protein [Prevotellaceae bacterium]|jgi:GT2 family glycosyltransferase|nr:glycosyltransferase family 2 protein [Prevotellaceae bacterium]